MDTRMRRIVGAAALVSSLGFLFACGDRDPRNDQPVEPLPGLAASIDRFGQISTFRMSYVFEAEGWSEKVEGDGAFLIDHVSEGTPPIEVIYGRTTFVNWPVEQPRQFLFLPPDLYIEEGDGTWFVQSPWHQGFREEEIAQFDVNSPLLDYAQFAHDLVDVTMEEETALDGTPALRYSATIAAADLQAIAPDDPNPALRSAVELWIRASDALPLRIVVADPVESEGRLVLEFSDYDEIIRPPAPPESAAPLRDAVFPSARCIGDDFGECLKVQTAIDSSDMCDAGGRRLCIIPLGQVPPDLIAHLVDHYRTVYGIDARVTRPLGIPPDMAEPLRQQIDADRLLDYMAAAFPRAYQDLAAVTIGVTVLDIYDASSHFRYVLGIKGTINNPRSIISTFRLDPAMYGEAPDQDLFYARVRKMTTKYVGLLFFGMSESGDPTSPLFGAIGGPDDLDVMTEPLPEVANR